MAWFVTTCYMVPCPPPQVCLCQYNMPGSGCSDQSTFLIAKVVILCTSRHSIGMKELYGSFTVQDPDLASQRTATSQRHRDGHCWRKKAGQAEPHPAKHSLCSSSEKMWNTWGVCVYVCVSVFQNSHIVILGILSDDCR